MYTIKQYSRIIASWLAAFAQSLKSGRHTPRPGTGQSIEFASTTRVNADPGLLDDFIVHVLGFGPGDPVFISDESCICDFGDDSRIAEIRERISKHYGFLITQPEPVLIADVLDRVRNGE